MRRVYRYLLIPGAFVMMLFLCFLMKTTAEARSFTLEDDTVVDAVELPTSGSSCDLEQSYYYMQNGDSDYNNVESYTVKNDVTIILPDGSSASTNIKFYINEGKSLTICGELYGAGTFSCAGIYGRNGEASYTFTLNSGTVTVIGPSSGNDSGIGQQDSYGCSECRIVINGGTLTVGAHSGVALGSSDFGSITINGGVVNASATGTNGIGICAKNVTINGGQVTASGTKGIVADTINLGYTDSTDFVQTTDFNGTLTVSDGCTFLYNDDDSSVDFSNYTANAKVIPGTFPRLKSYSLSLDGLIGVNFYVYLPENMRNTNTTMSFTVKSKNKSRTTSDTFDSTFKNDSGYYGFTCYLTSIETAMEIEASLPYTGGMLTYTCNGVKSYYEQAVQSNYAGFTDPEENLLKALVDYSHYIQLFLQKNNNWSLTDDYVAIQSAGCSVDPTVAIKTAIEAKAGTITVPEGVSLQYQLGFDEALTLRIRVVAPTGVTVTDTSLGERNGNIISISNIKAQEIGNTGTLTITLSDKSTVTITNFSALIYANAIMNSDKFDENDKKAMVALYNYYMAADAYFN
ncbi:MAG: hypothetical protein IKI20_01605 [Lachnospiraceae bacterium]|nr:hypothetical protein [Lachnospiraceae bacterium]